MKLWLLIVVAGFSAGSANAAGPIIGKLRMQGDEPRQFSRSFKLHVVQQEAADLSHIRRSGMIAQTDVAPNMDVGVGLFSLRRNRTSSLEARVDQRVKQSRKLGLSFSWRF